ncbi:MAG: hypothetical protein HQ492_11065 [Woeseiaceae bacterium]|nr:hypothetical protein [Woeseiaceae bacterium]
MVPEPLAMPQRAVAAPAVVVSRPAVETPKEIRPEIEIPEFIQDTLPDLEILAPQFAAVTTTPEPELEPELELESEPEPTQDQQVAAESDDDEIPAWDRTLRLPN